MRFGKTLALILIPTLIGAQTNCTTMYSAVLDPAAVTNIQAIGNLIATANGHPVVPVLSQTPPTLTLCFADLTFDATAVSSQAVTNYYVANAVLAASTQAQINAWELELSTTTAFIAAQSAGYVGASAILQIRINQAMTRIVQLRQMLGVE